MTRKISNEERYKLFEPAESLPGDHIGPSPVWDSSSKRFMGYKVGLYKGHRLIEFLGRHLDSPMFYGIEIAWIKEPFPIEEWPARKGEALRIWRESEALRIGSPSMR